MHKIFLIILFSLTIFSCGKPKEKMTVNDNSAEKTEHNDRLNEIADPKVSNIDFEIPIPEGINYKGGIVESAGWQDKNGSNFLFITETSVTDSSDFRSKELFGYLFISSPDGSEKLWQVEDFVRGCPFDLTLEFIPNSLTITDLDSNGIAESTFLYHLGCKSDLSPDDLKLMMHEGENKYAIRGETLLQYSSGGTDYSEGGEETPDPTFNNAPPEFLLYAKQQWDKFKVLRN